MLKISFDLDEVTKKISNLKVVSISNEVLESATVEVLDNKLKLSKAAIDMLGASANEKITINYWTVDNELTFPVIGKAERIRCISLRTESFDKKKNLASVV